MKWFKANWKILVIGGVISSLITSLLKAIGGLLKTLFNNETFWNNFLNVGAFKICIPLWILVLILIGILVIVYLLRKKSRIGGSKKNDSVSSERSTKTENILQGNKIISSSEVYQHGLAKNASINSKILDSKLGTFSIWAYVKDIHNIVYPKRKFKYIIAHATNGGNELGNSNLAKYSNVWAIQRLMPISEDKNGVWRFWCNNIDKNVVHLDYNEPLSGGWHLFSVSWSENDNYIKFIIDAKVVAESNFRNWPTDFSGNLVLGTWPTKHRDHYFDSDVGMWQFIKSGYDKDVIKKVLASKPK